MFPRYDPAMRRIPEAPLAKWKSFLKVVPNTSTKTPRSNKGLADESATPVILLAPKPGFECEFIKILKVSLSQAINCNFDVIERF